MNKLFPIVLALLAFSYAENLIEEIIDRYDGGSPKTVYYIKQVGDEKELVIIKKYYENGELKSQEKRKSGKEFETLWYYENGQIAAKGKYLGAVRVGAWTWYYENGEIRAKGSYSYKTDTGYVSPREGIWTKYYEDGQIKEEANFKNGKLEGGWIYYNKDGSVEKKYG